MEPLKVTIESITGGEDDCSPIPWHKSQDIFTETELQDIFGCTSTHTESSILSISTLDRTALVDSYYSSIDNIAYISGPMSGLPYLNYPAFFEAEESLQYQFSKILNPARNSLDEGQKGTWKNWMKKAIALMVSEQTTHIILLPGWETSKGALIEVQLAGILGIEILEYNTGKLISTKIK